MAEPAEPHVIRVRFDGGPRHGRSIDLVITGHVPLMLPATRRGGDGDGGAAAGEQAGQGLYELRCTEGRGTRYAWVEDLPVRR